MKFLAQRSSRSGTPVAQTCKESSHGVVLGSIPGLERLLPGRYVPGDTVRSRYGSWTLPRSFKGRPITSIVNGTIGWARTLTKIEECDACGDPLHRLEPFPVPVRMRPALSLLEALVDPRPERRACARDRLPPSLHNADRSKIFNLIIRIARAIDPEPTLWPIDDPAQRLRGLHSACHALERWPDGIEAVRWYPSKSITLSDRFTTAGPIFLRCQPRTNGRLRF